MNLREWLEAAAELEPELLQAPPLELSAIDAACVALNAGGHLRLVVDCYPLSAPRLRVRVIERGCAWWLLDSWGRSGPSTHDVGGMRSGRGA